MDRPTRLEDLGADPDGRRRSPSAARNRGDILPVLDRVLPASGTVVEIASGTGEHAVFFAGALPGLIWQPSDRDDEALRSIAAWRAHACPPNLLPPIRLDLLARPWPVAYAEAVVAINLLHIAPWAVTLRLAELAGQVLPRGGILAIYGAMFRDGVPTAPSNLEFDARLRGADPDFGVRRLEDVAAAARERGLDLDEVVSMPNHNITAVFRKA